MIGAVIYLNTAVGTEQMPRSSGQLVNPQAASAAVGGTSAGNNNGMDQYIPGRSKNAVQNNPIGIMDSSQSGDTQSSIKCQT